MSIYHTADSDLSDIKLYCVYNITYNGDKFGAAKNYIGSTSLAKIQSGYLGSVSSAQYKEIWKLETTHNSHLFKIELISMHSTRIGATWHERKLQQLLNVKTSIYFINKSFAPVSNSYSQQGEDNPFYNRTHTADVKHVLSEKQRLNWEDSAYRTHQMESYNNPDSTLRRVANWRISISQPDSAWSKVDRTQQLLKMRAAKAAKLKTEEYRQILSASAKAAWQNPNSKLNSTEYRDALSTAVTKCRMLISPDGKNSYSIKQKYLTNFAKNTRYQQGH